MSISGNGWHHPQNITGLLTNAKDLIKLSSAHESEEIREIGSRAIKERKYEKTGRAERIGREHQ